MWIETARCVIRPFTAEDIASFMAYRNNMAWMRFQGFKGLPREAYEAALLTAPDEVAGAQYALALRESDHLIGDLYLKRERGGCWIGYTVAPEYAGQGYAAEAVRAMLGWLAKSGIHKALAGVEPENAASIKLLERLGFVDTGMDAEKERLYALVLENGSGLV